MSRVWIARTSTTKPNQNAAAPEPSGRWAISDAMKPAATTAQAPTRPYPIPRAQRPAGPGRAPPPARPRHHSTGGASSTTAMTSAANRPPVALLSASSTRAPCTARQPAARESGACRRATRTQPSAKRRRSRPGAIDANSARIAWPHARRSAGSSRTARLEQPAGRIAGSRCHQALLSSGRSWRGPAPAVAVICGGVARAGGREAVQVPRRAPGRRVALPAGLEQLAIGQAHEDRVQRSRLQPDLLPQLVAIAPGRGLGREGTQHREGLGGGAARAGQGITLPI